MTLPVHQPPAVTLSVSETFVSIQGEGKLTGVPSLFIRLSGCNLRCFWCDTPYASWIPDGSPRTIDDLVALARSSKVTHAVLTGGEPMMFRQVCELSTRLAAPRDSGGGGMHITIETAGTIIPSDDRWPLTCHLFSISPKLSTSTPRNDPRDPDGTWARRHDERRINVPVLQELIDRSQAANLDRQLKFVFTGPDDLAEIDALLAQLTNVQATDVLLMPEGTKPPTQALKDQVVAACLARNWRYCPRLHIELFGNKRGT